MSERGPRTPEVNRKSSLDRRFETVSRLNLKEAEKGRDSLHTLFSELDQTEQVGQ